MKSFFKIVFASMLGVVLLSLVVLVLFFGIALSTTSQPVLKQSSVLVLDLDNVVIKDRVSMEDNFFLAFNYDNDIKVIGLNEWQFVLQAAAKDPNIKGISLESGNFSSSIANIEAMRDALMQFKKSGKFIYAYGIEINQGAYWLSSVADSIFLHPQGGVEFRGLATQVLFFKDLLDKYKIETQVVRHGTYKSAVEPFISDHISEANRSQITEYISSMWESICEDISESRILKIKDLNTVADNMMLYENPQAAYSARFVDGLMYEDVYEECLEKRGQIGDTAAKISNISYFDYKKTIKDKKSAPYKVAVVYAVGSIVDKKGGYEEIGENLLEELQNLRKNKSVRAVVLRVNSGGGSALMSDRIWREVNLLKEEKPVVVSMGDYAASGGYYISCAADYIVSEETTLTGSIGAFGMIPDFGKTLSDKLGINVEVVKTNTSSDLMSAFRAMTPSEKVSVQQGVDRVYDTFVKRVADGRNLNVRYVDEIGGGRVWTGKDAMGIGIVDTLGGLDLAIKIAAKKAKLANYTIMERPSIQSMWVTLTSQVAKTKSQRQFACLQGTPLYQYYELGEILKNSEGVQARMPYMIHIR